MSVQGTSTQELNGRIPSKNQDNSDSLIERVQLEGTPFTGVKQNDLWFLTWGNYVLTPQMETLEECKKFLETNLWDVVAVYVISVVSETDRIKQEKFDKEMKGMDTQQFGNDLINAIKE